MAFDQCEHQKTQIILRAGAIIRQLSGLSEETNVTKLYNETAPLLGVSVVRMDSRTANHLPSPAEMKNENGKFIVPRKDCPKCGKKEGLMLVSICPSCKDSEGGQFKSAWSCDNSECGYKDKSKKFLTQILSELNIDIIGGMKQGMGIKTLTNEGLK